MDRGIHHHWLTNPTLVTLNGYDCLRFRHVVAYKDAPATVIMLGEEPPPPGFAQAYPQEIYPAFFDRGLACYGRALEEFVHERYPAPPLLPAGPVERASVRMLAEEVYDWQFLAQANLQGKIAEYLEAVGEDQPYFAGSLMSMVDVNVAPLLLKLELRSMLPKSTYARRILDSAAFKKAVTHPAWASKGMR